MNPDIQTDEEAIGGELPPRNELLSKATLQNGRKLGNLTVRPMTAETLAYLFQCENFFIKGIKGERVSSTNANAIWSTAEFIYIHTGDPEEVAESIWYSADFKSHVRRVLREELNSPQLLTNALPIIEQMVGEYFAAQTEVVANGSQSTLVKAGKASARHGKQAI